MLTWASIGSLALIQQFEMDSYSNSQMTSLASNTPFVPFLLQLFFSWYSVCLWRCLFTMRYCGILDSQCLVKAASWSAQVRFRWGQQGAPLWLIPQQLWAADMSWLLLAVFRRPSGGRSVTTAVTVEERLGVGPAGGADKQEGRREANEKSCFTGSLEALTPPVKH